MHRARDFLIPALTWLVLWLFGQVGAASQWTLITILHTNDIHGSIMPRDASSGLSRAATLVKQIRNSMPNVILLDAGDIIHGTPEDYLSRGKASILAMNAVEYDAAATGNHEYDFGLDVLEEVVSTATFPFLAANIKSAPGGDWNKIAPYAILNANDVKIGVIGLTTLETVSLHWPGSIKDIRIDDPIATAKKLVPELRKSVDVLVILSHLGADLDRLLAREVQGIDFIVGGHSHTAIEQWEWIGDTLIAQTGAYCKALGRIDFIIRKQDTKAEIWSVNGKTRRWNDLPRPPLGATYPNGPLVAVNNTITEDQAVLNAYLPFRRSTDRYLSLTIGYARTDIPGREPGKDESPSANLMADAVREFAKSDVAIVDANAVGSRGLARGPIRIENLYNLVGGYTRQHIVVAKIRGRELVQAINEGFRKKNGVNIGVSGVSIRCRLIDGVVHAEALIIGGKDLEPDQYYTVAAQAYVMMNLMEAAKDIIIMAEPRETTREALVAYVQNHKVLYPPESGRITVAK